MLKIATYRDVPIQLDIQKLNNDDQYVNCLIALVDEKEVRSSGVATMLQKIDDILDAPRTALYSLYHNAEPKSVRNIQKAQNVFRAEFEVAPGTWVNGAFDPEWLFKDSYFNRRMFASVREKTKLLAAAKASVAECEKIIADAIESLEPFTFI